MGDYEFYAMMYTQNLRATHLPPLESLAYKVEKYIQIPFYYAIVVHEQEIDEYQYLSEKHFHFLMKFQKPCNIFTLAGVFGDDVAQITPLEDFKRGFMDTLLGKKVVQLKTSEITTNFDITLFLEEAYETKDKKFALERLNLKAKIKNDPEADDSIL